MERFFKNPQTIRQKRQGPLRRIYRRFRTAAERPGLYPRMRSTAPSTGGRIQSLVVVPPLDCEGYYSHQRKAIS